MALYHPLFSFVPDFTDAPTRGSTTATDAAAMVGAPQYLVFPQSQADQLFGFSFLLTERAEIVAAKDFFTARQGRTWPFYLPSWRADIAAHATPAGEKVVTIDGNGYAADHLTDTAEDHFGRQVFFWMPGETVWAERIVRVIAIDGDTEALDLDTPLPFAFDPKVGLCGFCHLVRFAADSIQWQHADPQTAASKIDFRGPRFAQAGTTTLTVAQIDENASLGYILAAVDNEAVEPASNRVGYSAGPWNLHYPQDDLYVRRWAAYPTSWGVALRGVTADETVFLPDDTGAGCGLFTGPIDTDHVTLAFDATGFEVVAYQKTAKTIEVRSWFNGDPVAVEFDGIDPASLWNYMLDPNLEVGETDVVVYYLKPGENVLYQRFQRDDYGTEFIAALLPLKPLALKRAFAENRHLYVEILGHDFRRYTLESAEYPEPPPYVPPPYVPAFVVEGAGAGVALSGAFYPIINYAGLVGTDGAGGGVALSGAYALAIVPAGTSADGAGAGLSASGALALVIIAAPTAGDVAGAGVAVSGAVALTAIASDPISEATGAGLSASGSYVPA